MQWSNRRMYLACLGRRVPYCNARTVCIPGTYYYVCHVRRTAYMVPTWDRRTIQINFLRTKTSSTSISLPLASCCSNYDLQDLHALTGRLFIYFRICRPGVAPPSVAVTVVVDCALVRVSLSPSL